MPSAAVAWLSPPPFPIQEEPSFIPWLSTCLGPGSATSPKEQRRVQEGEATLLLQAPAPGAPHAPGSVSWHPHLLAVTLTLHTCSPPLQSHLLSLQSRLLCRPWHLPQSGPVGTALLPPGPQEGWKGPAGAYSIAYLFQSCLY